ncbi:protein SERAC1-like isoform X2 [Lineus longissimus]|uniref:protein SERAC1-like isoform X2 n=1 Tax=Lineus longissimus TaxID=88925 RepID=UPI00315CB386
MIKAERIKRFSHNPWTLLKLAQSEEHAVRLLGVKALAEAKGWHVWQYQEIAQALDTRTMVGLARSQGADARFFLSPPKLKKISAEFVEDEFRQLLSSLPTTGVDKCTAYFTSNALQEGRIAMAEERGGLWCFGGNGLSFAQSLSPVPDEKVNLFCLQALLKHSMVPSHCMRFVRQGGLQLMQQIAKDQSDSLNIQRHIAQIIANISLHESLHADIFSSGWVGLLHSWLSSDDLNLSSEAARALANLDRDFGRRKYEDGVYLYHPQYRSSEPVYADIVFVHGLLGGAFKTWRQQDVGSDSKQTQESDNGSEKQSLCWPKDWLAMDCPNVRILAVEYETQLSEWAPKCPFESEKRSLSVRGKEMLKKLVQAGVGDRPVIWVGHSMGGLLIKQMLADARQNPEMKQLISRTLGVVFYSTPHYGTPLAAITTQAKLVLNPSIEVKELSQGSNMLHELHEQFKYVVSRYDIPILSFGETQKMDVGLNLKLLIVPPESSDPKLGKHFNLEMNHLNVCKPQDKCAALYQQTLEFLLDCIPQNRITHILQANVPGQDGEYILPEYNMK